MTTWFIPTLVVLAVIATALIFRYGLERRLDHRHDSDPEPAMADAGPLTAATDLAVDREARFERVSSPRA